MTMRSIFAMAIAATVLAAPLSVTMDSAAHAQQVKMHKGGGHGAGPGAGGGPKAKVFKQQGPGKHVKALPSGAKKHPMVGKHKPVVGKHKPPVVVKKHIGPKHKYAHRRWRPGLKWRWIVVPTIILAEDLDWCHYHRYPVSGMHYHKSIRCHQHARWDHPAIRYVEAY